MTPVELLDLCEDKGVNHGLAYVTLVIPITKNTSAGRRHSKRVTVLGGSSPTLSTPRRVLGTIVGSNGPKNPADKDDRGTFIVSVAIAEVLRWLTANYSMFERSALVYAEAGDDASSEEYFRWYTALRDRLAGAGADARTRV